MTYPKARPIMIAILLVATSLAGCLSTEDNVEKDTVYTSTWHIQDLVENIAGDFVNVELLAPTNVPVHDYEPTSTDLLYLRDADLFFYHGLGLETWVNTTLESMGDDAPKFVEVHTLPAGSIALEYEAMMVSDLCEHLTDGPFESSNLSEMGATGEIHAEHVAHRLSFPMSFDDVHWHDDDHSDEEGDHDDHSDEEGDHDDHDLHAEHNHLVPEETMDDPAGCPDDTVIHVYHMEEGHYLLEFAAWEGGENFDMSVMKKPGGHAHHDHHGQGEHSDEGDDHDDHSDEERDRDDHDDHSDEERDHDDHHDDDVDMTPELAIQEYDMDNNSLISWDEFWHAWIEDDHEFYDGCTVSSDPNDSHYECWMHEWLDADGGINMSDGYEEDECTEVTNSTTGVTDGWECERHDGDHDDHDDHEDNDENHSDHHDDEPGLHHHGDDNYHHDHDGDDGLSHADSDRHHGHDDHDDHSDHEEGSVCYNSEMNMISGLDNETSCGAYTYVTNQSWGETTFTGCYNPVSHAADSNMSVATCDAFMWMHQREVDEIYQLMAMFTHADTNADSQLDITELEHFIEALGALERSHGENHECHDGMHCFISIHIEAEGDYGFALPHDAVMHVIAREHDGHAGHDDHDDHSDEEGDHDDHSDEERDRDDHSDEEGDHDDHSDEERDRDDHSDEEGDHDDHSDEEGEHDDHGEEELGRFDPHSWLDPLSYRAQAALVRDALIEAFPEGEADFTANAEAYMAELLTLHEEFSSTLAACEAKDIAANHNAYAYMSERYDLQFVTVHGLDPEGEPTAADIAEVVEAIEEEDISIFYIEEFTDPDSVSSLVEQSKSDTMPEGVTLMTLHTMELPPKDSNDGYVDLMKENLDNILAGMTC